VAHQRRCALRVSRGLTVGKGGRPTKYHDERCDTILQTIRQGNTLKVAALMGGISYDTLNEWRKVFPEFAEAVNRAEAEAEALHVVNIRTHSADQWQASAWWLERRRHSDWRKVEEQRQTGPDGGPIQTVVTVERVRYDEGDE
jgi:hypothetical protein